MANKSQLELAVQIEQLQFIKLFSFTLQMDEKKFYWTWTLSKKRRARGYQRRIYTIGITLSSVFTPQVAVIWKLFQAGVHIFRDGQQFYVI